MEYESYNKKVHGELEEKYWNDSETYLVDSVNEKIDVIHMIASIDGIYNKTGALAKLGNHMERDILSWNGDLQQVCKYLKDNNLTPGNTDKMQYIFERKAMNAPKEDIIADIDAMNITKTYIDFDDNSISNSLSAYYSLVKMNNKNRYRMFVRTVVLDNELPKSNNELNDFENEIYCQFNIIKNNGIVEEYEYYDSNLFKGAEIMRGKTYLPSFEIRRYVTVCFVNFIESNL